MELFYEMLGMVTVCVGYVAIVYCTVAMIGDD